MPDLSVVVPVYDDPQGARSTVEDLLRQDLDAERFEVIVVDNGSPDAAFRRIRELGRDRPPIVRIARETAVRTSYAARNRGIILTRGSVICFVDAGMGVPPEYLAAVRDRFEATPVDYLGCTVQVVPRKGGWVERYERATAFPMREYFESRGFVGAGCLSVRASAIERIGPFEERLESGGDFEFGQRAREAGLVQAFMGEPVLTHPARTRYRSVMAKRRRVARGVALLATLHPERFGNLARTSRVRDFLPSDPRWLRARYSEAGMKLNPGFALGVALAMAPVKWAARLEFRRVYRRYRAVAEREGGVVLSATAAGK